MKVDVIEDLPSESAELRELNVHHTYPYQVWNKPQSVSLSFLARIKDKALQLCRGFLSKYLLADYLNAQVEFQANVVRCLNQLSERGAEHSLRTRDEHIASLHTLEKNIRAELSTSIHRLEQE